MLQKQLKHYWIKIFGNYIFVVSLFFYTNCWLKFYKADCAHPKTPYICEKWGALDKVSDSRIVSWLRIRLCMIWICLFILVLWCYLIGWWLIVTLNFVLWYREACKSILCFLSDTFDLAKSSEGEKYRELINTIVVQRGATLTRVMIASLTGALPSGRLEEVYNLISSVTLSFVSLALLWTFCPSLN